MEQVRQTARVASDKARLVADSAQSAARVAQAGRRAAEETAEGMGRIRGQMGQIADSMAALGEQGQAIGAIIATVDDLAQQSNLLAVNAAIEAAKAGERGRGFAVVAQEVRSLAEQSRQATGRVRAILGDIQRATGGAVMATEAGGKAVEAGVAQSASGGRVHPGAVGGRVGGGGGGLADRGVQPAAAGGHGPDGAGDGERAAGQRPERRRRPPARGRRPRPRQPRTQAADAGGSVPDTGPQRRAGMSSSDDEFLQELQAAFQVEADEHVQVMSDGLLELERAPLPQERQPILERVYREAHSLKGAARAVNMTDVETVCQSLETVFSAWKRQDTIPNQAAFDAVHSAVTLIADLLSISTGGGAAPDRQRILEVTQRLRGEETPPPARPPEAPKVAPPEHVERTERRLAPETVRIATTKLDTLLLQTEELLMIKLTAAQRTAELRDAEALLEQWGKEWRKIVPELRRARQETKQGQAARLLDFLEEGHAVFQSLDGMMRSLTRAAERDGRDVGGKVDGLLENTKKLLMLPFSTILGTFPKMVRDLSRTQGKDVQLLIEGGEVEIDKRILETLKDPLVHLLRNSVDHGIETPDGRHRLAKSPRATVSISVTQTSGNEVQILVADDGGGIDVARVKEAAVEHSVITGNQADVLSEADALMLIFQSDVSTSPLITEISGRGLGMAIVREKVEEAGGRVALETERDRGTTFRITLPLTLATFKGIVIEAGGDLFVVPTASVERVLRVRAEDIQTVENKDTLLHDGRVLPLVRLDDVLSLARRGEGLVDAEYSPVFILGTAEKRIGFRVDAILDEQEVLVKSLGRPLVRVRNVSGATVLGSGKPVPILNTADLVKSAVRLGDTPAAVASEGAPNPQKASILVAEDSITSRMLLKNILESAGYRVTTAVDGMDAFAVFRTQSFDLVVSDVDMPRMSGFDLTAKIRAEPTRADTPLILVTARDTREDRERGIDVGASAYIVKSSFDQSNLLAAVRRLI